MSNNRQLFLPDHYYHIYNHAVGFDNLFVEERNYSFFLEKFKKHALPAFRCYAYALLPNHFHFMVRVRPQEELVLQSKYTLDASDPFAFPYFVSQQWSNFLNSYAKSFNKTYKRAGALFRQATPRKVLDDSQYITSVIAYIHRNPIRHKFTTSCQDWKHTSFHELTGNEKTFLEREWVMDWFGNQQEFLKFHSNPVGGSGDTSHFESL